MITALSRFWSKVDKKNYEDCWPWLAGRLPKGYGRFKFDGQDNYAHRFSYLIENKFIPSGFCVLHKCDNPSCVNPNHLFLGTLQDNIEDKCRKNRQSRGERHSLAMQHGDQHWSRRCPEKRPYGDRSGARTHPESYPIGEKHWKSKLTDIQVVQIRKRADEEKLNHKELATEYGVSRSQIGRIVNRKFWKHLC